MLNEGVPAGNAGEAQGVMVTFITACERGVDLGLACASDGLMH